MKKFFTIIIWVLFLSFSQTAFAKTYKVEAITPFYSSNPPKDFKVRLIEPIINDSVVIYKNSILNGYIYQTMPPKRFKQSASFIYIPTSYVDSFGKTTQINNIVTKYTTKIDAKDILVNSAYAFGTIPIIMITAGVFAVQGATQDKTGNKAKASAENVYQNSPLSLIEKGDYLNIKTNQQFLLNFVFIKQEQQNYEFKKAN